MSKKHKRQAGSGKFLWQFVIVGGILIAVGLFLFSSQGSGGKPSITVDSQQIDYGDVNFNVEKKFTIKVTNTGTGILRFKDQPYIEILEGC